MGTKPSSEALPYAAFPDPLRSPVGRGRVAVVGEGFKNYRRCSHDSVYSRHSWKNQMVGALQV